HRWGQLVGLGYSANGKYLAASDLSQGGFFASAPDNTSGTALVWDMSKPGLPLVHRIELPDSGISEVQPSTDGKTLYVTTADEDPLTAYDLRTGRKRFQTSRGVGSLLAVDPTGRLVAATTGKDDILLASALSGNTLHLLHGPKGAVNHIAFSHDGSELAATSSDGKVTVWNAKSGSVLQDLNPGAASGVAFSLDGSNLFTTADEAHQIHV